MSPLFFHRLSNFLFVFTLWVCCSSCLIMKKTFLTLVFFVVVTLSFAQEGIGYFYDAFNRFTVFDKGSIYELENTVVDSVRVGVDYLAYIDRQGNLKVYSNGETKIIEESVPKTMIATSHALVYKMEQRLMIFQNGRKKQLASWADRFFAGDSIVVWQARPSQDILVCENNEIKTIETSVVAQAIKNGRAGRNIFGYSDLNNDFKVYYRGQIIETPVSDIRSYRCGRDVIAFIDRFNNSFNVFENGEVKTIMNAIPKSYSITDNIVSYFDLDNNFMVYYKGESTKLESYEPVILPARGNMLIYYFEPELKLFYEGKLQIIEKFINPQSVITGMNSFVYLDNANRAKYFYKGKLYDNFLFDKPKKIELYRDLPAFTYGNNTIGFFYNGKVYEYSTSIH